MNPINLKHHAYAVDISGYTIMPGQVDAGDLERLREGADRALARSLEARTGGKKLRYTYAHEYYNASRCMYCWGNAFVQLLDHPSIHGLAKLVMGEYKLWDMLMMSALPAPAGVAANISWHRDFTGMLWGPAQPGYLWCNVCLDDITVENGGAWVVPGSHKRGIVPEPENSFDIGAPKEIYPTRTQVTARAGDIIVFNPTMVHDSGHNKTDKPRRLLNVGLCQKTLPALMNHWAIAGSTIREKASDNVRAMLNSDGRSLDESWDALPPNWQTA